MGKSTTLKIQFYQDEDGWENPTIYVPNSSIAKASRKDNKYDVTYNHHRRGRGREAGPQSCTARTIPWSASYRLPWWPRRWT